MSDSFVMNGSRSGASPSEIYREGGGHSDTREGRPTTSWRPSRRPPPQSRMSVADAATQVDKDGILKTTSPPPHLALPGNSAPVDSTSGAGLALLQLGEHRQQISLEPSFEQPKDPSAIAQEHNRAPAAHESGMSVEMVSAMAGNPPGQIFGRTVASRPPTHGALPEMMQVTPLQPQQAQPQMETSQKSIQPLSAKLQSEIATFVKTKNKNKRVSWKEEDKKLALQVLHECGNNICKCLRTLHASSPIFQTISHKMLRTWKSIMASGSGFGRRGRKASREFETDLLSKLGYVSMDRDDGSEQAAASRGAEQDSSLTYNVIITAAEELRKTPQWAEDQRVQNLKLSHHWVQNFLDRFKLRRKKNSEKAPTGDEAAVPATDVAPQSVRVCECPEQGGQQ
jgi:hypothetical protein